MKPEVLEALEDSIAHWERMRDGTAAEHEIPNVVSCALCVLFFYNDCDGCPVKEKTKHILCRRTPYRNASMCKSDDPKWHELHDAEVQFLRSLLPKQ